MERGGDGETRRRAGLTRKEFIAGLAALTGGLMVPRLLQSGSAFAAEAAGASDRMGRLLPLRRLGSSGQAVTCLGVGGAHIGSAPERDAQAVIEKAIEEGIRFFDNAPFYGSGIAERRYGKFLVPKYRDIAFLMTKTQARDKASALRDLDESLARMKTDYVDLWQMHALEGPGDVEERVKAMVLDAFLEAKRRGKARHFGFTGHSSYKAHLKMLEVLRSAGFRMAASQMPINPADPHYESFILNVMPRCLDAGIGVLAMKTLADGRFFGGNAGWGRTHVSVKPIVPELLSIKDVLGFVWSLPVATLISGMETPAQVSYNAALARLAWDWDQAERQKRIDAVRSIAGPNLEFYKD